MSGGSYGYLCFKSAEELFQAMSDLEAIRDRLIGLGYAEDAARETEELILIIEQYRIRAGVRVDRLQHVWHAIEWWDSHDSGEDSVKAALEHYRTDKP